MSKSFNGLTPAEVERLANLMEECAEVQQIIGKILRFGYGSFHPNDPTATVNRKLLGFEIGNLQYIIHFMNCKEDINPSDVLVGKKSKYETIREYSKHQEFVEWD